MLCPHPQLGVKALTYNDLIQAQKEISAHNQQLREQSEQLEKDNSELRSQSLRLVCAGGPAAAGCTRVGWREDLIAHSLAQRCALAPDLLGCARIRPGTLSILSWFCKGHTGLYYIACLWVGVDTMCYNCRKDPLHCPESLALAPFGS